MKYGDCKGKTALILAFLKAFDIPAEAVLVSSTLGDVIHDRLPNSGLFDHVIVRVELEGQTYWLDGTKTGEIDLSRIQTGNYQWGLPLRAEGAELIEVKPDFPNYIVNELVLNIDATGGTIGPIPMEGKWIYRGRSEERRVGKEC